MADNNPLSHVEEVVTTKHFKGAAPLDAASLVATLAERDVTPDAERYHMMRVDVQENGTQYILDNPADLTNTGWRDAFSSGSGYLGTFDPNVGTITPNILRDGNDLDFSSGDWGTIIGDGFWNFTTGDTSPDGGGDHIENLTKGEKIIYNSSGVWVVEPSSDLVQSVNGKQGIVVVEAQDVPITPIAGLTTPNDQTQEALQALKNITDGISTGSVYLGAFDPNTPGLNPPKDGDTVNYNQGDFGAVNVAGFWNFTTGDQTPDGGGDNVSNLTVGDFIRFNANDTWDVIPSVAVAAGANTEIQFNNNGDLGADPNLTYVPGVLKIQGTIAAEYVSMDSSNGFRVYDLVGTASPSARLNGLGGGELTLWNEGTVRATLKGQDGTLLLVSNHVDRAADFQATTSIIVPKGTVAQRPATPAAAMFRFNIDDSQFEGHNGTEWGAIGGGGGGLEFVVQTINHSVEGALDIDFALGNFVVVNLTANVTSITFTNPVDGEFEILFVQDAIGSRSISFTGQKTVDGANPDYSTNGDAESLIRTIVANGSVYMIGAGNLITI